jgi:AcrR family transcriptional regulator
MPMTESSLPRTQEQRRIEAERRLVHAAAELVGEIGPGKVTLANVGERAGYSRGLATHHFGSKGALMQRLVETVTNQFRDAMAEESQSDSPIDQLRQLIDFYFAVLSDLHPVNRARLVLWADAVAGPSKDVRPQMIYQRLYDKAVSLGYKVQEGSIGGEQGRFAYLDTEHDQGTVIEISDISGPKGEFFSYIRQVALDWDGSDPIRGSS